MNSFDKFGALGALAFIFVCMTLLLFWLKGEQKSDSFMPSSIDSQQSTPLYSAEKNNIVMPKSVLQYGGDDMKKPPTVQCMLEQEFRNLINTKTTAENYSLVTTGQLDKDNMQIYKNNDGDFFVAAIGPDGIGRMEACIVAEGQNWQNAD